MNKNKFQKGFTLIELLVVIAIIGILASMLMVNLSSTRDKAKDSSIKLEMGQIRTAMESAADSGSYDGLLDATSGEIFDLRAAIETNGATLILDGANDIPAGFCIAYALNTSGSNWCVDSTGYAGPIATCDAVDGHFDCDATD
ncbi:MAG: type II secretion system protein [Patescibacteria group bacterium]